MMEMAGEPENVDLLETEIRKNGIPWEKPPTRHTLPRLLGTVVCDAGRASTRREEGGEAAQEQRPRGRC